MTAQQLKNSILKLAISGKLVPQDPNDEPASVLVEKIRKEKEKLIKEGKIKKEKNPSYIFRGKDGLFYEKFISVGENVTNKNIGVNTTGKNVGAKLCKPIENVKDSSAKCINEEIPFEIPESWEWCRLSFANEIYTGNSINENVKKQKYTNIKAGYNYIGTKDVGFNNEIDYDNGIKIPFNEINFRIANKNSVLLCIEGGSAGRKIAILKEDVCFGNKLCCFRQYCINEKFLYYYLQSNLFIDVFKENTTGIIGGVSVNTIKSLFLPLPPLQEQQRIVLEIERYLPLINEYNKLQTELDTLDNEFPEKLKKSILQEAIKGKLVEQDPSDEPASVLLDKIRKEKEKLIKEGKIKKDKNESIIYKRDNSYYEKLNGVEKCIDDEIPFEIPESWEWARLKSIVYNNGQTKPNEDFCYIDIGSIDNISNKLNDTELIISPKDAPSRARKIVKYGDIIYSTVRPYLHNICIINREFSHKAIASTGFAVMSCFKGLNNQYLFCILLSPQFDNYANSSDNSKGVAYPAINDEKFYNALVPLAPYNEQARIIKKIYKLTSICQSKM